MGRICAWCGSVLCKAPVSESMVSHALCGGCLEELRTALASSGMQLAPTRVRHGAH